MADPDEATLIQQVITGDESAFRVLFRRHSPVMYAVALRMLGRRVPDAEDAVQEGWLRAVRGLPGFRGDSALRTWLIGITARCSLEIGRRRGPESDGGDPELAAPIGHGGEHIDLERAIAALPAGYRHVLILHDLYGYTHAEIAALADIEEGTSKSQLSRARSAMKRLLSGATEGLHHES